MMNRSLSVIGLGKLGSCLAAVLAEAGHRVTGIDYNEDSVAAINDRVAPVQETGLQKLLTSLHHKAIRAQTDYVGVEDTEMSFIVVPTPSDSSDKFINDYVIDAVQKIGERLATNDRSHTVVVCSTVMPGSCKDVIEPALAAAAGKKVSLLFSPEFIALGSVIHDMKNPDLILIGGENIDSVRLLVSVIVSYLESAPVVAEMSWTEAELAKLAINCMVTTKISYANMISEIAEKLPNCDARKVLKAVGSDSRIGSKYLRPGANYSGPCFPRDSKAVVALGEELQVDISLAKATGETNDHVKRRVLELLKDFKRVAILGLSYKPDTSITEESLGMFLVEHLSENNVTVSVHDPVAVQDLPKGVEFYLTPDGAAEKAEAIVVATPWGEYRGLSFGDRFVIDCWGITKNGPKTYTVGRGYAD